MNGYWIPDSMKGRKLTAKDYKRLYSESVGYERDNVPDRMDAIRYEIEKNKILLMKIADPAMREELWGTIIRLYEDMNEVQRLHRCDLGNAVQRLEGQSAALISTMKAHIDRTEKSMNAVIQSKTEKIKTKNLQIAELLMELSKRLSEREQEWLQHRTAPKRTNSKGGNVNKTHKEIARAMKLDKNTVWEIGQRLERMPEIKKLFDLMEIQARKPRGTDRTKQKKEM